MHARSAWFSSGHSQPSYGQWVAEVGVSQHLVGEHKGHAPCDPIRGSPSPPGEEGATVGEMSHLQITGGLAGAHSQLEIVWWSLPQCSGRQEGKANVS